MVACFVAFITNLFVGPSQMFHFPNNIYMLALGQILKGSFDVFIMIPALPEMIDVAVARYPKSNEI